MHFVDVFAPIAQLVEHSAVNRKVIGSTPVRSVFLPFLVLFLADKLLLICENCYSFISIMNLSLDLCHGCNLLS